MFLPRVLSSSSSSSSCSISLLLRRRRLLSVTPPRQRCATTLPTRAGWRGPVSACCHVFKVNIDARGRRHIRVHHINRENPLGKSCVLYIPGFMRHSSDLEVRFVANHCLDRGYECIIYDPEGLGMSSGYFSTIEFDHWMEDCEAAAAQTFNPRLTLVAPSMGAIIGVKLAQRNPGWVTGLLLPAPAITIFEASIRHWYDNEICPEDKARLDRGETVDVQTYWGRLPLRKGVLDRTYAAMLDLSRPISVAGARVVMLHGKKDNVVHYTESFRLQEMLEDTTGPIDVVLSENGNHRLNDMTDLLLLSGLLDMIVEDEDEMEEY